MESQSRDSKKALHKRKDKDNIRDSKVRSTKKYKARLSSVSEKHDREGKDPSSGDCESPCVAAKAALEHEERVRSEDGDQQVATMP